MTPTDRSYCYQISLEGHLEERWLRGFEGVISARRLDGTTVLEGEMDHSTLHGILNTIRDLGMELISVQRLEAAGEISLDNAQTTRNFSTEEPNQ